jgi:3-deoxy-7-phosphoheptulonate synthase
VIVVLDRACSLADKTGIVRLLEEEGYRVTVAPLGEETVVGIVGAAASGLEERLLGRPGVRRIERDVPPYPLVSRTLHPESTAIRVGDVTIGATEVVVIAGPCSVESEEQILTIARSAAESGARMLRGGAFKPRTSPYGFQGLGEEGLRLLATAREATGLPVVTEVVATEDVELVASYADVLQVGARNMQNFSLLRELGKSRMPVMLKRGISATIEEWLLSAEYILAGGNTNLMLCERGIRTFESYTRNTLDISAIPVVHKLSHLPVVADPSHGTGRRDQVSPMARAAVAAGADALIIEVHCDPDHAQSDGAQSMFPSQFDRLMAELRIIAPAIGRTICVESVARRGWSR